MLPYSAVEIGLNLNSNVCLKIALQARYRRDGECFHQHSQPLAQNQEIDTQLRPKLKVHEVQTDPKTRYFRLPLPPDKRECHRPP